MWFRSRVEAKRVVKVFGTVASLKIDVCRTSVGEERRRNYKFFGLFIVAEPGLLAR